jgi:nucleotide-binding universal stress UspA family protein
MLKTILVPLDGSALAEEALPYACALSVPTASRLILMRASYALHQDQLIKVAEDYLAPHVLNLRQRGFDAESTVFDGDAAPGIVEQARRYDADLVVMATHGRTGPGHWILGSVAEAVLATCSAPVLLVRAWQQPKTALLLEDQPRLLVPLDGSAFAEGALQTAMALADDLGGELILTRVDRPPAGVQYRDDGSVLAYVDQQEAQLEFTDHNYLDKVAARVSSTCPELKVVTDVRFAEPAAGIAQAASNLDAALVVMATHGRTGISRMRLGSVAGQTLKDGVVPLVLIGPGAPHPIAADAAN